MKLAYLILAHAYPAHLHRMVTHLQHTNAHFFIHIDQKAAIEDFASLSALPNVVFVTKRVKVSWAGFSIVQATINGFEEIMDSGMDFDFITLLSGQDYPIKSSSFIEQYLQANPGKIFMHTLSVFDDWQEAKTRITDYHFINMDFPGKYRAEKLFNSIMPKRKFHKNMIPVGRSQWFTITGESAAYILKYLRDEKWITNYFKLSWAPDEIIFHTILFNSPFKENMTGDNLCYVDWSKGGASPKTLGMEDAGKLVAADKLFARKFHPDNSKALLDYIDSTLLKNA